MDMVIGKKAVEAAASKLFVGARVEVVALPEGDIGLGFGKLNENVGRTGKITYIADLSRGRGCAVTVDFDYVPVDNLSHRQMVVDNDIFRPNQLRQII